MRPSHQRSRSFMFRLLLHSFNNIYFNSQGVGISTWPWISRKHAFKKSEAKQSHHNSSSGDHGTPSNSCWGKHELTWSSTLPSFCTMGSESICMSSPSPFCFSIREALDTLKMPWTLTRTLTFTLELSPSGWGTTFWTEKHPGDRWKQNECFVKEL